jgi:glyoxylase-like metal-dependent hydrolase (beta-lactamase superfamily II)
LFSRLSRGNARNMLTRDVAPGIHRIEDAHTNWYLVEDDGAMAIVDAGVPRTSWQLLHHALRSLGRSASNLRALVLTHAHFDHIGFAEQARRELGLPVYVHRDDVKLPKNPQSYERERTPLYYVATKPRALPIVAGFLRRRAFWPAPIAEVTPYEDGTLDIPGAPRVVFTPGHTHGHCALHFPDRNTVIAGDAVVMLNPYTGGHGPQIVARAANADSERALASLDALAATGAQTVLTGHGEPWRRGAAAMADEARRAGIS